MNLGPNGAPGLLKEFYCNFIFFWYFSELVKYVVGYIFAGKLEVEAEVCFWA